VQRPAILNIQQPSQAPTGKVRASDKSELPQLRRRIYTNDGEERPPAARQVQEEGLQLKGRMTAPRREGNHPISRISERFYNTTFSHPRQPELSPSTPLFFFFSLFFFILSDAMYKFCTETCSGRVASILFLGGCIYSVWCSITRLRHGLPGGFNIMKGKGNTRDIWARTVIRFYYVSSLIPYTIASRLGIWDQDGINLLVTTIFIDASDRRDIPNTSFRDRIPRPKPARSCAPGLLSVDSSVSLAPADLHIAGHHPQRTAKGRGQSPFPSLPTPTTSLR